MLPRCFYVLNSYCNTKFSIITYTSWISYLLDLTSVTRADSTLENSRSNLHCLRGPEITLVFDYVVRKSHVIDYVVVEASREANLIYITTEEPL